MSRAQRARARAEPIAHPTVPGDQSVVDDGATLIAFALLIAVLGGIGRIGVRAVRRGPPPVLPEPGGALDSRAAPDAIEAELQEILAEERSRDRVEA